MFDIENNNYEVRETLSTRSSMITMYWKRIYLELVRVRQRLRFAGTPRPDGQTVADVMCIPKKREIDTVTQKQGATGMCGSAALARATS